MDDLLEDEAEGLSIQDASGADHIDSFSDEDDEEKFSSATGLTQLPSIPESEDDLVLDLSAEDTSEEPPPPKTSVSKVSRHSKISDIPKDEEAEKKQDDATVRLGESKILPKAETTVKKDFDAPSTFPRFAVRSGQSGVMGGAEAVLAQSESLRFAQKKIHELEDELENLRSQTEQLAAAGETLRKRADELLARAESAEARLASAKEAHKDEKEVLLGSLASKEREVAEYQRKVEELEVRLSTNLQKIRVRERELENRLELVKMESSALVRSKDEIILDLKRQLDQLNLELSNYRLKGQELNKQLNEKQEVVRRTVKALRLALSMLEGEDSGEAPLKKAK